MDDNTDIRLIVSSYLDGDDRLSVVDALEDGHSLLEHVRAGCPDVVVLDNQMPGRTGPEVLPELRDLCPTALVVMYSADPGLTDVALTRGADCVVDKSEPLEHLLRSIHLDR